MEYDFSFSRIKFIYLFLSESDSLSSLTILSAISSVDDSSSLSALHFRLLPELLLESSFLDFILTLSENFLSAFSDNFLSAFLLRLSSSDETSGLHSSLREDFLLFSLCCNLLRLPELRELDVEYPVSWRVFL